MNSKYELVVVVDAVLPQQEKEGVIKEASETITKFKGKVINSQVWLEKHRFTFPVKKRTEGTYYLINFEGVHSANAQLRDALKLNEKILRSLIAKVE